MSPYYIGLFIGSLIGLYVGALVAITLYFFITRERP